MKLVEFIRHGQTVDDDGFKTIKDEVFKRVWADVLNVFGSERENLNIDLNIEVIKLKFDYFLIKDIDVRDCYLKINGNKYEVISPFENDKYNNKKAYIKVKRSL